MRLLKLLKTNEHNHGNGKYGDKTQPFGGKDIAIFRGLVPKTMM